MNTLEAITTRRSIRQYRDAAVPEETVTTLLRAAMSAPSAMNEQPWEFVVIDDRALLARLAEHAEVCAQAPVAILICADVSRQKAPGNWMLDCSAATQNLLLAAHHAGLGAVWTGGYPDEGLIRAYKQIFSLPENVVPLALVPIGYPAEQKEAEDRFLPDRIHRNGW